MGKTFATLDKEIAALTAQNSALVGALEFQICVTCDELYGSPECVINIGCECRRNKAISQNKEV